MATPKSDRKITELDGGRIIVQTGDEYTNRRTQIAVHETEFPTLTGRLAFKLIEHFGVVAAMPGGEDSAGRQSLALLPEADVVSRAFNIAELAVAALRERGHVVTLPSPYDADLDDQA